MLNTDAVPPARISRMRLSKWSQMKRLPAPSSATPAISFVVNSPRLITMALPPPGGIFSTLLPS